MSVQVGPFQGHQLDPAAAMMASTTAGALLQDMQAAAQAPAGPMQAASSMPQALNVCCNGNYGIYLLARRGVQCMCMPCQADRVTQPQAAWIMSPTEFERHSGMPTAKKWRMSIKVAHAGEPELPLGRWLELKGISQTRGSNNKPSPDSTQDRQLQKPKQASSAADSRDTTDAMRPCATSLARVLLQGLGRDQSGQMQGGSRPGTPQRSNSNHQQLQQEGHVLSEEPPHCNNGSNGRAGYPFDVAAQLRSCFPSQQAGAAAAAAAAAVKMEAARMSAYAAAAAEAEAAAERAERQACHHHTHEQGSNEASPNGGRSSSSSQGGQPRPSPPALLHIPCPADAPPRPDDAAPLAAALYNGVDPVPLEEAVAAAARGDDSLWLRSPMRRTPCSARQGPGGASRMSNQEAVAAEAFRRLISAHLNPKAAAAAVAAAGGRPVQGGTGLSSAAAAAAALLAGAAGNGSRPSDGSSSDALAAGVAPSGGSMDNLAAAAAAAAAADAAEEAAMEAEEDGEEAEGGIFVGPEHQADLPRVRPLPAFSAAMALVELKKSGNRGPDPDLALRMAMEEKVRADLLPRDAVEDVWERAATGLALERAQRQRKPPGWQAGYVDPLKPLNAQQQADSAPYGNTMGGTHEAGLEGDSARNRKRSGIEELLQSSKKVRCSSAGPTGGQHIMHNGIQASRLGLGAAKGSRRASLEGTAMAGCCSERACPGSALHSAPRVPPNGFWAPPKQPTYTAPVGPELLSWVLMVPPAAATLARPAWADPAPGATAPPAAPVPAPAAAPEHKATVAEAGTDGAEGPGAGQLAPAAAASAEEEGAAAAAAPAANGNSMDVDTPPQQQQDGDAEMADAVQEAPEAVVEAVATQAPAAAAETPAADSAEAASPAVAAAPAPAAAPSAAAAGPQVCLEGVSQGSAVEVRIVLDGCVFVGQLKEVSRLEMARSRVGAAVEPIKQTEVHRLPPPGTACALCHAMEAPGAHMDQAKALRSSGLSNRGLGPLMPVCMPPAKQAASGNTASGLAQPQTEAAAGAEADSRPAAEGAATSEPAADGTAAAPGSALAAEGEVVWVHRQCALWSPEVYPDKSGMLMHLPGAVRRGRATRCSHCSQKGATLKCAERSCAQHFHLACARVAGCTLVPEPYTVGCPAHEPKMAELPTAAVLTAFPSSRGPQDHQQHRVVPEHPQLPVLRCRTTRHRAVGDVGGTPVAGSRDREGGYTPLYPGGGSPMHMDSCGGLGGESDFTPRAGSEDRDLDAQMGSGMHAGHKRSRGGQQSRLRRQTNTDWADARYTPRPDSPAHMDDGTPTAAAAAAGGRSAAKPTTSRGSRGAGGGNSTRGSFGSTQLHDSRGRFMSHAAAQLLASGFTSTPPGSARHGSIRRDPFDGRDPFDSRGGTPAVSDGGYSTPRGAAADADGNMSDVSSGAPLSEATLGGTTGQPGRAGRCAVCVVQRKGKCGTESAPKKCLRRQLQEQQQAERAKKAAPIHSVAAAANAVAIAAAEAEALAAFRGSPALKGTPEPTSATAMSALALAAAEAEALCAARGSPAFRFKQEQATMFSSQRPQPAELEPVAAAAAAQQEPAAVTPVAPQQEQHQQLQHEQRPPLGPFQQLLLGDTPQYGTAAAAGARPLEAAAAAQAAPAGAQQQQQQHVPSFQQQQQQQHWPAAMQVQQEQQLPAAPAVQAVFGGVASAAIATADVDASAHVARAAIAAAGADANAVGDATAVTAVKQEMFQQC